MSDIILTPSQKEGIRVVEKRFNDGKKFTSVAGFAGTGKSTIVNYMIQELNLSSGVVYVTFTGRASLVLRQKGIPATTIHKLIYTTTVHPVWKTPIFNLKTKEELNSVRLIVIDEVSMVSAKIMNDLMSFGIPIIGIGDPFQLPPIGREVKYLDKPNVFLTEIHRQAEESKIIWASKKLRNKEHIPMMSGNELSIVPASSIQDSTLLGADQILCGYNKTRIRMNQHIRELNGVDGESLPQDGEKLICLANDWDLVVDGYPLVNGMIGTTNKVNETLVNLYSGYGKMKHIRGKKDVLSMDFTPDFGETPYRVLADRDIFDRALEIEREKGIQQFDFGYVITTHKAQGSQYPKVLIYEEVLNREMHWRWLYTALTRAESMAVIARKG